jgi:hypothetical protein
LVEEIGRPQQIISEVVSGFASGEREPTIRSVSVAFVDLDVADVAPELQRVLALYLREIVRNLISVVVLTGNAIRQAERWSSVVQADGGEPSYLGFDGMTPNPPSTKPKSVTLPSPLLGTFFRKAKRV